jgi:hypothetical protein
MQIAQPRGAVFLLPCSFLFLIAWQVDEQGRIGSVECDGKFSCKPACKGKLQMDLLIAIKSALRPALEGFLQPVCFVLRFLLWLVLVGLHWWGRQSNAISQLGNTKFQSAPSIPAHQDGKTL